MTTTLLPTELSDVVTTPTLAGVRVGCDVVRVERVAALLRRRPSAAVVLFTDAERADAVRDHVAHDSPEAMRRLAARFAAKEAVVKLLGRPSLAWTDVEVRSGSDGAPVLHVHGEPAPIAVSLSHDGEVAMAMVAVRTPQP